MGGGGIWGDCQNGFCLPFQRFYYSQGANSFLLEKTPFQIGFGVHESNKEVTKVGSQSPSVIWVFVYLSHLGMFTSGL